MQDDIAFNHPICLATELEFNFLLGLWFDVQDFVLEGKIVAQSLRLEFYLKDCCEP